MRKSTSRSTPARVKSIRAKSDRQFRSDGFVNVLTKYGTKHDSSEAYRFEREPFVSDMFLTTMYEGNGLFVRIIDTPAEEALKHGFELNLNNKDLDSYVEELLDELEWEEKAATAIKWARLYGGSIIVMIINDGRGIDEPVDWNNIKSIDELLVFERAVVTPDYSRIYVDEIKGSKSTRIQRFGEPQYYLVSSTDCYFTVHESRCLIFRNGKLPDQTSDSNYRYWGMPEYVRIKRALRETITAHENSTKFLERSVQPIYSMKNLASILGTDEGEDKIMRRLDTIDMARSLMNSIAIDADGESYDFKTFQFTGIKDVIDATCNMLSALTNIPQTILFGRSPAGMNATGESDFENYYNFIERIQKQMLKKNLRYLLDVAFKAGLSSGEISEEPKYKLQFNPLWSLSENEQAAVEQTRAATALTKAQTAQVYIDMQAMDPSEVRAKLASDDDFIVEEIVDEEADNDIFNSLYAEESGESQSQMPLDEETNSDNCDNVKNDEGNSNSGHHGHEGRPGEKGGSLPSGKSFSDRMKKAFNYKANGKGYNEVNAEMRRVLKDMPVGSKVKIKGTEYEKTGDGQFKYQFKGEDVAASINGIANSVDPFDIKSMPEFEEPKSKEVASAKVEAGKLDPRDTSVQTPQIEPAPYKGKYVVDIDAGQFQSLREELQRNTGKTFTNEDIEECLSVVDEYRGTDYTDIVAASAGFSGPYAEYGNFMSDEKKKAASAKAQKMEEFITNADKYEGKVMRAMGFDVGGDFDNGSVTESLNSLLSSCKPGRVLDMGHISSWTTDRDTISQILNARTGNDDTAEKRVEVVFTCPKSSKGVDVGRFSKSFTQGEVAFSKDQCFKVKTVKEKPIDEDTVRYDIEVEEV